jgi:hypothetical protein
VLSNPTNPFCIVAVERARFAATALHLDLEVVEAAEEHDLDRAFLTLSRQRPDAVLTIADPFLTSASPPSWWRIGFRRCTPSARMF